MQPRNQRPATGEERILELLATVPREVNREAVLAQWKAVKSWYNFSQRSLPRPVWEIRAFEDNGDEAWKRLSDHLSVSGLLPPISIYIHVPFCQVKCGFCDCYSLPLGKEKSRKESDYLRSLLAEMETWAGLRTLPRRPVTTVHFGGGTPNSIEFAALARIVSECRVRFATTPGTEWALESTSRLLSKENLLRLWETGFRRLHVGVQTLEEGLRRQLGRKDDSGAVLGKLAAALELGFTVSVDVLYGLPGQDLEGITRTLERLVGSGIHGFSLYRLQVTGRNRAFLDRWGIGDRDPLLDYLAFQVAESYLRSKGFRKIFFTHFARPPNQQLYQRQEQRGEDLLAMGPTAAGIFGHYAYRHPEYGDYLNSFPPGLEGGLEESPLEQRVRPVRVALMGASVSRDILRQSGADDLLGNWAACDMVDAATERGSYNLTANGSWFITTMIKQVEERVREDLRTVREKA